MGEFSQQTPQFILFLHDSSSTWEKQLETRGVALALMADTVERNRLMNAIAEVVSDIMGTSSGTQVLNCAPTTLAKKDAECEFTRFPGNPYVLETGLSVYKPSPCIVQYHLRSTVLKCISERLFSLLKALSTKLPQSNDSRDVRRADDKRLEILTGTLLRVESGALYTQWFKAESSGYSIILPLLSAGGSPKCATVTIETVSARPVSQNLAPGHGEESRFFNVIRLENTAKPVVCCLEEAQFIVLKEGELFRLHNFELQDLFLVCLNVSVVTRTALDPILSPCRMTLREVFTVEELLVSRLIRSPKSLCSANISHETCCLPHSFRRMKDADARMQALDEAGRTPTTNSIDDHQGLIWSAENAKRFTLC